MKEVIRSFIYSFLQRCIRNTTVAMPLEKQSIQRVLILRYDRLGDMVVTLPLIDLVREQLPSAQIDILASEKNCELVHQDSRISSVIVWDGRLTSLISLRNKLRSQHYDVVFCTVFYKLTFAGMLVNYLVGAKPIKIMQGNASEKKLKQYHTWFNTLIDIDASNQTMIETLTEFAARAFGINVSNNELHAIDRFKLPVHQSPQLIRKQHGIEQESQLLFMNLSAGVRYRECSLEKNTQIALHLLDRLPDAHLILNAIGTMQEQAHTLRMLSERIHLLPQPTSLNSLIDHIHAADVVITPDTSITHFASACRKPTVVLCTPLSSSVQWLPYNVPYRAIFSKDNEGVDAIPLENITKAIDEIVCELFQNHLPNRGKVD